MANTGGIGANVFDNGNWYHEILEDGLAISYRVRAWSARARGAFPPSGGPVSRRRLAPRARARAIARARESSRDASRRGFPRAPSRTPPRRPRASPRV